jgi:hypothetical protein
MLPCRDSGIEEAAMQIPLNGILESNRTRYARISAAGRPFRSRRRRQTRHLSRLCRDGLSLHTLSHNGSRVGCAAGPHS